MAKWANDYPVRLMCRILQVNKSAYYEWKQHGAEVINAETFALCSRMKALFIQSRESLGSRGFVKHLRKEGYDIGRYRVRRLMKQLQLVVKTKRKYRVTTQSKHAFPVAENVLNRKFNPEKPQSSLGKRHHVCMDGARLVVLGRGDGFIFAAHCWLVYGPNHDTSPGDSGTDDGD